ncbi:MAG: hypothetical protein A2284_15255 [Deltaproteobacteria bacterium RIFOXYA12_FULL_61_11]|nr:MAG: hypothetical protein A2284_15255 [Deltaproteobacteria bacterium RIFOXYA12_FULL_61_11]
MHAASPQSGAATFTLQIQELYHYLKDIFRSIAEKDYVFDFKTCHEIVAGAVDHILAIEESQLGQDRENEVVRAIFEDYEHDLLRHSISVFLICIEVGCTLRQPHEKLVKLGMASLLHDLIMYHMPERLLTHSGAFSESDRQDWRRHIREGFEHLSTVALPPWIANIVFYLVRKNLEFPVELKQRDQFEFAMIIEMANSYEAITHRRSWRTSLDSFAVVSAILKSSDVVPQYLIKALFMTFSIFAPNSYVLLNNGEVALVIGVNKNYPLRPRIRIVFDSQKHFKKVPRELDLKEHRTFTIVDPVPNDEVERWRAQGG